MKKFTKVFAMVLILALTLSMTAVAAAPSDKPVITVLDGEVSFTDDSCQVLNVSITHEKIRDGEDYMIWVIAATKDGDNTVYLPTASSILYLGQATASGNTFTFNGVYPKQIVDCAVMISGRGLEDIVGEDGVDDDFYTLATIKVPYKLGDVDLDGDITAADAVMINKHLAGSEQLSGTNKMAADIDKDGDITAADAVRLNKYLAGGSDEV